MEFVEIFVGKELLNNNKTVNRHIIVTEAYFLTFETTDANKYIATLTSCAPLQSLLNIRRNKNKDNNLILTWRDLNKKVWLSAYSASSIYSL